MRAHLLIHAADNPEIDERDDVAEHHQHIAGMRIGVEQAVDRDLLEDRVAPRRDDGRIEIAAGGTATP
jgi:hypothetical protein